MEKRKTLLQCILNGEKIIGKTFENKNKEYEYKTYVVTGLTEEGRYKTACLTLKNGQIRPLSDSFHDLKIS